MDYFSDEYKNCNPTWDVDDSPWKAKQIHRIIEKNGLWPNTVCEVGCGAGEILNQLMYKMDENISFIGYEISPDAFELCNQRKKNRLEFKLSNILEEAAAYYDLVLLIDVIEHIEDVYGFLRGIKDKAEYKIFHIPLSMTVSAVMRMSPLLYERKKVGHIHYFSKETALETLKETGYEILDYYYTGSGTELTSKRFAAKLLTLPRKVCFSLSKDLTVRLLGGYSLIVLAK